ncbi:hypothetical protein [Streptomyces sp. TLI_171]|uniref:hypothetical protein n=1 Tax=Streptomyces sp. TLI_171 TaxID=1938859 RepID=UPI000C189996|nr:hypothetical protein [Streptomyces sp. TLI_171]RKE20079.1 hypothetical protein BX266_3423 [Streptomyces sp. TLI_171]
MTGQTANVTDERLCWLLARDQLAKQSARPGAFGWFTLVVGALSWRGRGARQGREMRQERSSQRTADYALAVDDAAETLTADERRRLRATRQLPEWFMADVERRYAAIRKAY